MKKIIFTISFLLLFLIKNISAQNISLTFGGGYLYSDFDNTKLPYWENGYLFSFSSDYKITDHISIFFSSSYQKHFFDKNLVYLNSITVAGYRYSINGENSSVIELSIGSKLYATS